MVPPKSETAMQLAVLNCTNRIPYDLQTANEFENLIKWFSFHLATNSTKKIANELRTLQKV